MFRTPSVPCLRPWHSPGKSASENSCASAWGFLSGNGSLLPTQKTQVLQSLYPADITPWQPGVMHIHPSSLFASPLGWCVPFCPPELPSGVALELSRAALDLVTACSSCLPPCLTSSSPPGISWDHPPDKTQTCASLSQGCFWEIENQAFSMALREYAFSAYSILLRICL